MNTQIQRTATPLHIAILHTGTLATIRSSLECIRDNAGYPHSISVVDISGNAESNYFLHTMRLAGAIDNLIIIHSPIAPAIPLMQTLASVESPYSLVFTSGTTFNQPNWLANLLEQLVKGDVPALSGFAASNGEQLLLPVVNPSILSSHLCQPGHIILSTRAALDRLDVFTRRGLTESIPTMPHSADIAARETLRTAVQNLH